MSQEHELTQANDAFAKHIASFLQEPVTLDRSFDMRVMASVRALADETDEADAKIGKPSPGTGRAAVMGREKWWLRQYAMSPIRMLTVAAGAAIIASTLTLALMRAAFHKSPLASPGTVAITSSTAPADTVYMMRFAIAAASAHSVSVVGDFNGWAKHATPLTQVGRNGLWTVEVPLPPGRYEYAFIVDGQRWVLDPLATHRTDDFDTESSVVTLGS